MKKKRGKGRRKQAPVQVMQARPAKRAAQHSKLLIPALLGLIVLLVIILRWRLLGVPLERDEGEYAYMGQLMLQGIPPYSLAYNMKFPGTHFIYAILMAIFGQSTQGVHIGLMLVNITSVVLLFFVARSFMSPVAALLASAVFGLLSLASTVLGFAFHATHLVTVFALGGTLVLLQAFRRKSLWPYFWSGVLLGLGVLMKQSGVFFVVFGGLAIILHGWTLRSYHLKIIGKHQAVFAAGSIAPIALLFALMYLTGVFDKFWFWTFTYLREYGTQVAAGSAWGNFIDGAGKVVSGYYLFWIIAGMGLLLSFFRAGKDRDRRLLWLLALCAALTVVPGLYFRKHYFIAFLPVVGLFFGLLVDDAGKLPAVNPRWAKAGGVLLFVLAAGIALNYDRDYLFAQSPQQISRDVYGFNPFPESVVIADYIRERTSERDLIAVIGSEPQIPFYSRRLSSTGYIYTYNMMELHDYNLSMQQEMAAEIERYPPKYMVYVYVPTSWLRQEGAPSFIFDWFNNYTAGQYEVVGVADMITAQQTIYKWDAEAAGYQPQGPYHLKVYRKRE